MEFKFIAVNGDNVGDSIGSAIATDNHEELSKITSGLQDAHGAIEQWIESVGGEVVTSSGDEGIYKVPAESFDESTIESLREQYSQSTGTTITVGIGASMSEASKALIYGKLNDKDQVVQYDPHIDDYIAGHDEEIPEDTEDDGYQDGTDETTDEEIPTSEGMGEEMVDAPTDEAEFEAGMQDPAMDMKAPVDGEEYAEAGAEMPIGEEDPQYQNEVPEMEETAVGGEAPIEETDEAMPDSEMGAEEETVFEEGEMSESDLDVAPEDRLDDVVGTDIDGDGDIDAIMPEEGMEEAPMGAEMPMEDEEGMDPMAEGVEGEMPPEAMEAGAEMPMEGEDDQGALTDMIHANMGEEGEEGAESDEELRQDIANSLITFKENKAMLEQAKTENPKLYEATILMLRSMIEMAKKLNMNPEADVEGQMAQEEFPDAEQAAFDEGEEQEDAPIQEAEVAEEDPEDAEGLAEVEEDAVDKDKKENPFGKNEMAILYSDLMKGMATLQKVSHLRSLDAALARHKTMNPPKKGKIASAVDSIKSKLSSKKPEAKEDKKIDKGEKKYWRKELQEREAKRKRDAKPKKTKGKKPLDAALEEVERKMKVKKEVTSKKK